MHFAPGGSVSEMVRSVFCRLLRIMSNRTVAFSFVSFYLLITLFNINTMYRSDVPKIDQRHLLTSEIFVYKQEISDKVALRPARDVTPPTLVESKKIVQLVNATRNSTSKAEDAKSRRKKTLKKKLLRDRLNKQKKMKPAFNDTETFRRGLLAARSLLAQELSKQNSSSLPFLRNATAGGTIQKILLATTWRSGSTFIGELLAQIPGAFYSFEPLLENIHILKRNGTDSRRQPPYKQMDAILNCNFSDFVFPENFKWVYKHNVRYFAACKDRVNSKGLLCDENAFLSHACQLYPVHVLKTVRLRFRAISKLFKRHRNLKVIFLFRDPRGFMKSRVNVPWCRQRFCWDLPTVCDNFGRDLNDSLALGKKHPRRVFFVRYEDFCLDARGWTQKMFDFLGIPLLPSIEEYLRAHTMSDMEELHKRKSIDRFKHLRFLNKEQHVTYKATSYQAFSWRRGSVFANVTKIQEECSVPMGRLGYLPIKSASDLNRKEVRVMRDEQVGPNWREM